MQKITKRERIMAAVKGESVDHVPASYFNHNHAVEFSPDTLVPALLQHNQKYDWDFIKVILRASYYMEAWGSTYRFAPKVEAVLENNAVKSADDFQKLEKIDPTKGPFGEQVQVAKRLAENIKGTVPIMQTVFSSSTVAGRLAGGSFGTTDEMLPFIN